MEQPMRLTQFADYSLRLLMLLAEQPERRVTIAEASGAYGISRHHLMKVALHLAKAGFIRPIRGRNGGLVLARSAKDIRIGDVLRATEPDFALVGCMRGEPCTIVERCRLPKVLAAAIQAFLDASDRYVLADLVVPQTDMVLEMTEVPLRLNSASSCDA